MPKWQTYINAPATSDMMELFSTRRMHWPLSRRAFFILHFASSHSTVGYLYVAIFTPHLRNNNKNQPSVPLALEGSAAFMCTGDRPAVLISSRGRAKVLPQSNNGNNNNNNNMFSCLTFLLKFSVKYVWQWLPPL